MNKKPFAFKNAIIETQLFRNRCIAAAIIIAIFTLLLVGRLVFLQVKNNKFYSTLSQQNILNMVPIPSSRGLIFDRNGVLIAKNVPTYTLSIINNNKHTIKNTIKALRKIIVISDNEVKRFYHVLRQYHLLQPVPLKYKLSEQEVAKFYVNQYRFPNVSIQTRLMRSYPLGSVMSHVLGYVGRMNLAELRHVDQNNYTTDDDIGKMGIEKYYEKPLHGTIGMQAAEINAAGHIIRVVHETPQKPGKNLYLTIDSKLQSYAQKIMGQESGSIVMLQPNTGEILALVSNPSFDPNLFTSGLSQKEYHQLLSSPSHPLYNRAIRGQFAPGSTVKPFIALQGLQQGIITPESKVFDPGWFKIPGTDHIYHGWKRNGHGWVNLQKAITVSCDAYFYQLAVDMGIRSMDNILHQFGYGQATGIDLPEEVSGLVPTPDWKMGIQGHPWYTGDTVETGIGQGYLLVTPVQLAHAVAMIAERGQGYQPHLLLKSVDATGNTESVAPIENNHAYFNSTNWDEVIEAMESVVDDPHGTAHFFGPHPHYKVAAKTGTAQIYGHQRSEDTIRTNIPKKLRNNHLFIAFAPVSRPQVAIAVVVEHSAMADNIAGKLIRYYIKHSNLPPNTANKDHHD